MNSYTTLATIYEKLMKDCDYDKWSQYLLNDLKKYCLGNNGLDLACGSGKMTRILAKNGYNMVGGDISEQMLIEAKNLCLNEHLNVNYFVANLTSLIGFGKFDFVTIINDGVNYVEPKKIEKMFKGIYKNLKKDGILIFDISSEYKLKNILANNLFGEDWEDFSYLWFNKLYEDRVEMDLSFFIKSGEYYKKSEEKHIQYIHNVNRLIEIAEKTKFELISFSSLDDGQRDYFIMRRK